MNSLSEIREDIEKYKKAVEKFGPLNQALAELEARCQRIIDRDVNAVRENRYGSIPEKVEEALRNRMAEESTRRALAELAPILRKALNDVRVARQRASDLRRSIETATLEARGAIATKMQIVRQRIKAKIVALLEPFTNPQSASKLAEQMDVLVNLDFRTTNLAVSGDLFSGFEICVSAAQELKKFEELAA